MFDRNTAPTVPTLEALCKGLGITLASLLLGEGYTELDDEQKELLSRWNILSAQDKQVVLNLLKFSTRNNDSQQSVRTRWLLSYGVFSMPDRSPVRNHYTLEHIRTHYPTQENERRPCISYMNLFPLIRFIAVAFQFQAYDEVI